MRVASQLAVALVVSGSSAKTITTHVEAYDWFDNGGNANIAYPKSDGHPTVHNKATEGKGTWADPVTFAGNKANFTVGER
jgi:hypothetical protein